MELIAQHLRRLTDFSGRENRQPFWLWVLVLYVVQTAMSMVITFPLTFRMMNAMQALQGRDQTYLNEHPEIAQRVMMEAFLPFFRGIMVFAVLLGLVQIALIAAAVVRRLHDTNRSGWWAAPVLAVQIATLIAYIVIIPKFFGVIGSLQPGAPSDEVNAQMGAIMPGFILIGLLGFVGFICMVTLIILLCLRGTVGPNRYGEDLLPPPRIWTAPPSGYVPPPPPPPPSPARIVRPWDEPPPA